MRDLSIEFCGVKFSTPFLLSASGVSNTAEMIARGFEKGFGGVSYKTLCVQSYDDMKIINPSPRTHAYNYGSKKLVGLQNVESVTDRPLKDNINDIKWLKKNYPKHIVIGSIMGFSKDEWRDLALACEDAGVDMLELNLSCPHMEIEGSGAKVGQVPRLVKEFTHIVRNAVKLPILVKLTPNVTDMTEVALYAKEGGADGITAINTVAGLSGIGLDNFVPFPNVFGKGAISGFSGPVVKPIGLRFIAELAMKKELGLPLSGVGGIETWVDAVEYLLAGASTVQMTTSVIRYGHRVVEDMCEGLSDFMDEKGFKKVKDIVGKALPNIHETSEFDMSKQGAVQFDLDRCIGCGDCYIACQDAGAQCITWDSEKRRPSVDETKCYTCMACSFVCPIDNPPLITFKEIKGKKPYIPEPSKL